MRDMIFLEIRECNKAISKIDDFEIREKGGDLLIKTIKVLSEMAFAARREGLLYLEEFANETDLPNKKYLQNIVRLIVDGTEPELVEAMSMVKYYSSCIEGYEALQYLIILIACLSVQAGQNHKRTKEEILWAVPEELVDKYNRYTGRN